MSDNNNKIIIPVEVLQDEEPTTTGVADAQDD